MNGTESSSGKTESGPRKTESASSGKPDICEDCAILCSWIGLEIRKWLRIWTGKTRTIVPKNHGARKNRIGPEWNRIGHERNRIGARKNKREATKIKVGFAMKTRTIVLKMGSDIGLSDPLQNPIKKPTDR